MGGTASEPVVPPLAHEAMPGRQALTPMFLRKRICAPSCGFESSYVSETLWTWRQLPVGVSLTQVVIDCSGRAPLTMPKAGELCVVMPDSRQSRSAPTGMRLPPWKVSDPYSKVTFAWAGRFASGLAE